MAEDHRDGGGAPFRRLVPYAVVAPIVLGALVYAAESAGWFGAGVGFAILTVAFIAVAVAALYYIAGLADRAAEERRRIEHENALAAPRLAERAAELERINAELEATSARLERSNEELQRFATVASHDLREPLRVVSGFAELLDRRYGDKLGDDGKRFVEAITGGVARMDEMISDLLAYARAGRSDQPFETVDMNLVVSEALSGLGRAIEDAQAQVEVDELPPVLGNPSSLRQVFQNLVANALKFVDGGPPRIRIWAAEVPEGWRFSVRDNGIGIAPDKAEKIFGMFTRLHGGEEYPGTGVGLALCQRIVDVHGGQIWVEPAPGGGSQFMFTIARVKPDDPSLP